MTNVIPTSFLLPGASTTDAAGAAAKLIALAGGARLGGLQAEMSFA